MIQPPFLKPGNTIAICSIAKSIDIDRMQATIAKLVKRGYNVVIGRTIGSKHHQFADTDAIRSQEFQQMINDPSINAILFARGGYGALRVIDNINFNRFKKYPKWICGFSDMTAVHAHLNKIVGVQSIHSLMCSTHYTKGKTDIPFDSLMNALEGKKNRYEWKVKNLKKFKSIKAEIIGGNLSMLYALNGSKSMPNFKDKILFIEDLDEYRYHIDRMMINLKRSGTLKNLKAMLVGSFTQIHDNEIPFGMSIEDIILDACKDYDFPIITGMPAGHQNDNRAITMGKTASVSCKDGAIIFEQ